MPRRIRILVLAHLVLVACAGPSRPDESLVRVDGRVVRGPTQPVCQVNVPCEAPFSAGFSVQQSGRPILRFRSDADGRFSIQLTPGSYVVVPDADAPIIAPQQQVRSITVSPGTSATIELSFDTGIR
jgi:hypothetical protein